MSDFVETEPVLQIAHSIYAHAPPSQIHPTFAARYEAAGGPNNGHRHLENSNIDWGQDLLFLKAWLEKHAECRPMGVAYYNAVSPTLVGLEFELPPLAPTTGAVRKDTDLRALGPRPGYFAVSANLVIGGSYRVPDGYGGRRFIPFRAYQYFDSFEPIAKAGYSIFIYKVTREQANAARLRLGCPMLND